MAKINITKEEFEDLYFNLELSTRDIAAKLGVGLTTVRRFMNKHGIKARTSLEAKRTSVYLDKQQQLAERYSVEYKKYCSEECKKLKNSKYECRINENGEKEYQNHYTCEICGKEFDNWNLKHYIRRFCDDCVSKHKSDIFTNKIKTTCAYCGKELKVIPSRFYANKYCYCDVKCMAKHYSEIYSGENSPTWKGGVNKHYKGNWLRLAQLCRERDNNCCQICGKTVEENNNCNMDVHHIKKYRLFEDPIEANQLDNLISLCHNCHSFIHSKSNIDLVYIKE